MKIAMKCVLVAACALLGLSSAPAFSATVAQWTFETSAPVTAGPVAAEVGTGSALGLHAGAAVYSSPAGNGSAKSFSANTWAVGDYWQFQVSTVGYSGVTLSWDQTASNTGPRDFQLAYSADGINFTNFGSVYSVLANAAPNAVWNATTSSSIYNFFYDLSSVSVLDNQTSAYFRLVDASSVSANGGTVAAGGTNRIDNFIISAAPASVPAPAAVWLLGSGIATLAGFGRRRKSA